MKWISRKFSYFTKGELVLWSASLLVIIISFVAFDGQNYITLLASIIGVTSLIFNAKGNPFGQLLMVIFSLLYGYISFRCAYYGEMITYLGMTMPMAMFALISWLKHPYNGNKSQVAICKLPVWEWFFLALLTIVVSIAFCAILRYFNTANIIPSTLSITTSFVAVYLTFRRNAFYAISYALNDIVLIVLWSLMAVNNTQYIAVIACFVAFLINDIYGFVNWRTMERKQLSNSNY